MNGRVDLRKTVLQAHKKGDKLPPFDTKQKQMNTIKNTRSIHAI